MSCEVKQNYIDFFKKKYGSKEGSAIGTKAYESIIESPEFKKWFGNWREGDIENSSQMKDSFPTPESVEKFYEFLKLDEKQIPRSFIDGNYSVEPKNKHSVKKDLIKRTEAAYNIIAREVTDIIAGERKFLGDNKRIARLRNSKIRLKNQLNVLLDNLKKYRAEDSIVEYLLNVTDQLKAVNTALDDLGNAGITELHEYLQRFKYFGAVEDALQIIAEDKDLAKYVEKEFGGKGYANLTANIIAIKQKITKAYVPVIAEKWGETRGKVYRLQEKKYRRSFTNRSDYKGTDAEYEQALNEYVKNKLEENKDFIQKQEKQNLIQSLSNFATDINFLDYLVGNPRDLSDDLIQIVVEILDSADYTIMIDTVNKTKEGFDIFKRFIRENPETADQRTLYKDLLGKDKNGKVVNYLINKYQAQFYIDRFEILKEMRKVYAEKGEKSKEGKLIKNKWRNWKRENTKDKQGTPIDKYIDPNYEYFANKDNKGQAKYDMYQFLLKIVEERDQNYLGHGSGFKLPAIEASGVELAFGKNNMATWAENLYKDTFKVRASDIELHKEEPNAEEMLYWNTFKRQINVLVDQDMKELKTIPKFFRNHDRVEDKFQSYDLMSIYLMDYWGSVNYREKNLVLPEIDLFKESLSTRGVISRTLGNTKVAKTYFGTEPVKIEGRDSNAFKALQSIIESRIYGIRALGNTSLNKIASSMMAYTGNLFLIGNYFSAGASIFQGKVLSYIRSAGGVDFTRRDIIRGDAKYLADVLPLTQDIGKLVPSSKTGLLSEKFKSTQDWSAVAQKFAAETTRKQLLKSNTLHFVTNMAENYIQNTLMYSFLNGAKIKNSKGEFIDKNGKVVKERSQAMSLDEAYELDTSKEAARLKLKKGLGSVELQSGLEFSLEEKDLSKTEFEITRYLSHLNRRLNGNYDSNNQAYAQRHIIGKFIFMLRKWLEPGIRRRYRGLQGAVPVVNMLSQDELSPEDLIYNREIKDLDEGTYVSTIRFINEIKKDLLSLKGEMITNKWYKLTAREKANIHETVREVGVMFVTALMGALLYGAAADEPDEVKKRALFLGAFYSRRLYSELRFYTSAKEFMRILRSPAASLNIVEQTFQVLDQLSSDVISTGLGGDFERYKQGKRKGQLKLAKELRDLTPIWYQTGRRVDEAVGFLYKEN